MYMDTTTVIITDSLKLIHSVLHFDSLSQSKIVLDTLLIKNISDTPSIPIEIVGLLGVILGGIISFITSLILETQKSKIAIKRDFFSRRFEAYNDIMKLVYKGYSVIEKTSNEESSNIFPKAYETFEGLREWLNTMVDFVDKSLLLIDQDSYQKFNELNWKILEHIRDIRVNTDDNNRDLYTRNLGRRDVSIIQSHTKAVMDSIRNYLNKIYNIKVEEVK